MRLISENPDGPILVQTLSEDDVYRDAIGPNIYGGQFIADNHGNFYSYEGAKFVHGPHNLILKHILKTKGKKWVEHNKGAAYGVLGLHRVLIYKEKNSVILNPYSSNVSQTIITITKRLAHDLNRQWSRDNFWCSPGDHKEQFR